MEDRISKPKRFAFILLVSFFSVVLLAVTSLRAHPPSNLELDYKGEEGVLEVTITHSVGNPSGHYIESVLVKRNGDTVKEQEYEDQPERNEMTYEYQLKAENGDTFEVEAECNRFGDMTGSLSVEGLPSRGEGLLLGELTPAADQLAVEGDTPSSARGLAVVLLDPGDNTLKYSLAFKGLSGPPTEANFLKDGVEGQVILTIFGDGDESPESNSGFVTGKWDETSPQQLTSELVSSILEEEVYVIVKTELNPKGELIAPLKEVD